MNNFFWISLILLSNQLVPYRNLLSSRKVQTSVDGEASIDSMFSLNEKQRLSKIPKRNCLTTEINNDLIEKYNLPSIDDFERNFSQIRSNYKEQNTGQRITNIIITIPVVVHVIHNGEEVNVSSNISALQVQSQIEVLNEDFRRKYGTSGFNFHEDGADVEIEFAFALRDEFGNVLEEPGIHRVNGNRLYWESNEIEDVLKPQTIWDPAKYLNLWTVSFGGSSSGILGYAQFPILSVLDGLEDANGLASTDGVVIGYQFFGRVGNLGNPFDLGRTTTHEIGHWLGLRHIWGDGGCLVDDYCKDTPRAGHPNYECQPINSCWLFAGQDMIENYMDYTPDACMNIFTQDQKERMRIVMYVSPRRYELLNSNVHLPSNDPCENINLIGNCGPGNVSTFTSGGYGIWNTDFCNYSTPGIEKIYSFSAPTTGIYNVVVTSASGYVDYGWKTSSCSEGGWNCIADINSIGTYGQMSWIQGNTYYIILDDENSTAGTHQFYINCPSSSDPCQITVNSPSYEDVLVEGETYKIEWSNNIYDNVRIELYDGFYLEDTIANYTSSDGSYYWTLSSNSPMSKNCRIKITDTSNASCYDYSDYFSIINFEVSPDEIYLGSLTGESAFDISTTSFTDWSISESSSWFSISPTSGSNDGTIALSYDENTSTILREDTITIFSTGIEPKIIIISQEGKPNNPPNKPILFAPDNGDTLLIPITSPFTLTWEGDDPDGNELEFKLLSRYKNRSDSSWSSITLNDNFYGGFSDEFAGPISEDFYIATIEWFVIADDGELEISSDIWEFTIINSQCISDQIVDIQICEGENFSFGNLILSESGTYQQKFVSIHGCDSTVTLNLVINSIFEEYLDVEICKGEFFAFGNEDLFNPGTFINTFQSLDGCDSTVTLNLSVKPVYEVFVMEEINDGETFSFGANILTEPGTYIEHFESINGCDSTVTLELAVILGIENFEQPGISIYPVPFSDYLKLEFQKEFQAETVRILDLNGKIILKFSSLDMRELVIDTSSFPKGKYFILLQDINGLLYIRTVIKN